MDGLRAIRWTLFDIWEESALLVVLGVVGGALSLLIVPLPLVVATLYGVAADISHDRAVGWRPALATGRANARFFYRWLLLVLPPCLLFGVGIVAYGRLDVWWAAAARWLGLVLLVGWLLPQPFVPALYWRQSDRRVRTALRNALLLTARDPLSALLFWLVVAGLGLALVYASWPFVVLLLPIAAVYSTRIVWLKLASAGARRQS